MAHLQDLDKAKSEGLKAITINGCIHVESEEDVRKRAERRAQRKSRWGDKSATSTTLFHPPAPKKSSIVIPGEQNTKSELLSTKSAQSAGGSIMPTQINASILDEKSQQIYLLKMEIQEASLKLSRPDLGIPTNLRDRSPSPEPIYNDKGIRINTRQDRVKSKLINQRNNAITKLKILDPFYQPPASFKYKNAELEDRVLIPADEYPHINFMGLLLGPRGNSLEELKKKTNCVIVIRGKGSIKSGMTGITKDGRKFEAQEDPLHAYITGSKAEDVKKAVKEISDLINMQVYHPDSEKSVALRAKHMHELAVLNGTLKDVDMKCMNCGRLGHRSWECGDSSIFTASVICTACGGVGHIAKDCKHKRPGSAFNKVKISDSKKLDSEYDAFIQDLDGNKKKRSNPSNVPIHLLPESSQHLAQRQVGQRLMLKYSGGEAPGAASAKSRAISAGQAPGGMCQVMGKSIFGGKLTKMTSGYKSQSELELERKKKLEEQQNQPIPLEWQVQKYEQHLIKRQDQYLKKLEKEQEQAKEEKAKLSQLNLNPSSSQSVLNNLPQLSVNSHSWKEPKRK